MVDLQVNQRTNDAECAAGNTEGRDKRIDLIILVGKGFFKIASAVILIFVAVLLFNKIQQEHDNSASGDISLASSSQGPLPSSPRDGPSPQEIYSCFKHKGVVPDNRTVTCGTLACVWLNQSDRDRWNKKCFPKVITNYKVIFLINIVLLIAIGGLGNMLTLLSVCYTFYRPKYKKRFPFMWTSVTMMLMHLSLCDMLYCVMGLPFFLATYIYGEFPFSDWMCWLTTFLRHIVAYADFLTLALIAVTRLVGIRRNLKNPGQQINQGLLSRPVVALICCMMTWCIAFFIVSWILFEVKSEPLGIDFGEFGYAAQYGMCNTVDCPENIFSGGAIVYTVAFFIPFLAINISYILLAVSVNTFLKIFPKSPVSDLGCPPDPEITAPIPGNTAPGPPSLKPNKQQANLHQSLIALSITYVVFCGTLLPIEWSDKFLDLEEDDQSTLMIVVYNWYWWVYAVNNIVYMLSLPDFRTIWFLFLRDMRGCMVDGVKSLLANLRPNRQGSVDLSKTTDILELKNCNISLISARTAQESMP